MNMEPTATAPGKSIWGIVGDVFFSPAQAFEAFKKKPSIWVPLILVMVMAAAGGYFTAGPQASDQYNMMRNSTVLPPTAIEEMRQAVDEPNMIGGAIGPAIVVPLIAMISALLAWFIGGFLFGGKAKFSEIWGTGLLAMLIPMIGGLIKIPMALAKGTAQVSIGPAALMAHQTDYVSILGFLLLFTDVFAIWSLVVISFGYSAIFGISLGKGTATAIITWVIMTSLAVGAMLIGLSFAGLDIRFM